MVMAVPNHVAQLPGAREPANLRRGLAQRHFEPLLAQFARQGHAEHSATQHAPAFGHTGKATNSRTSPFSAA